MLAKAVLKQWLFQDLIFASEFLSRRSQYVYYLVLGVALRGLFQPLGQYNHKIPIPVDLFLYLENKPFLDTFQKALLNVLRRLGKLDRVIVFVCRFPIKSRFLRYNSTFQQIESVLLVKLRRESHTNPRKT